MNAQLSVNNENISNRFDSNELRELTRPELSEVNGALACYQFSSGQNPSRYIGSQGNVLFQRWNGKRYVTISVLDPADLGGGGFDFRRYCRDRGYGVFR
jgi:hypothetical protein